MARSSQTGVLKMPKIKPQRWARRHVLVTGGTICSWLQRWVVWYFLPHLVFVVPPWSDDLYYLALQIKEGVFRSDPMKPAFRKLWNSAPIAQQPCCGREAKQWKSSFLVAAQPSVTTVLLFGWTEPFDAGDFNYCLSVGIMHTLLNSIASPLMTACVRCAFI